MDTRDLLYVIGLMGFGLTTMFPVFYALWRWGPEVGRERVEVTYLTPPGWDRNVVEDVENVEAEKEEVTNDELVAVGR